MILKNLLRPFIHFFWLIKNKIDRVLGSSPKHIVICGFPRSGTSLMLNMLSTVIEKFKFEEFEVGAQDRLHRSGNFVTKYPLNILDLDEIESKNKLNKKIFFIVIMRDIRDVLTSRHPNVPDEYFIGFQNSWWPQDSSFKKWNYNAPGINDIYRELKKIKSNKRENLILIRYEDLVNNTENVQIELKQFLGIDFTGNLSDFYKHKDKHVYNYTGRFEAKDSSLVRENDKIDTSRVEKWKLPEHHKRICEQFTKHPELFQLLIDYNYETDQSWFEFMQCK